MKNFWIWGGVALLIGLLLIGWSRFNEARTPYDVTQECVTHENLAVHIHPMLSINIDGVQQPIPGGIGLESASCFRPVHTHDDIGMLHVESARPRDFALGDFFKVWNKTFTKDQILDSVVDANHEIVVTVNGVPNTDYENLILKDHDQIVITYKRK